jgi:hypothetical protein
MEIEGFRAKAGGPAANGRSIKLKDGRELFSGGSTRSRSSMDSCSCAFLRGGLPANLCCFPYTTIP